MALSDNLQGWWCPSLDTAGNGTTTLTDLSGNGNNGTLTNMDAATDWVADTDNGGVRALDFDGVDDYVTAGVIDYTSWTKITFGGWIYVRSAGAASRFFSILYSGGDDLRGFVNPLYLFCDLDDGSVDRVSTSYSTGQWVFVVGTYDGSTLTGYKDGTQFNSVSASFNFSSMNGLTEIGRQAGREDNHFQHGFDGLIDSVFVYSRVLTSEEVSQLYNGGRSLNLLASGGSGNIAHVLRSIQQQHESVVTL